MSADTHKFGYAAKGTSVVLYRGDDLRHHQYFTFTDWPGGLYATPTFAGSRPGGLSAACWAAMVVVRRVGLPRRDPPDPRDGGDHEGRDPRDRRPASCSATRSTSSRSRTTEDGLDVYRVMDEMTARGWSLNGLHRPACVHICVTLRHTQPELAERFGADLRDAVAAVRAQPEAEGGMAPIYGLAASVPDRTMVSSFLEQYMDRWYIP